MTPTNQSEWEDIFKITLKDNIVYLEIDIEKLYKDLLESPVLRQLREEAKQEGQRKIACCVHAIIGDGEDEEYRVLIAEIEKYCNHIISNSLTNKEK